MSRPAPDAFSRWTTERLREHIAEYLSAPLRDRDAERARLEEVELIQRHVAKLDAGEDILVAQDDDVVSALSRAAERLGAVRLASGDYAHYADETSSWWVVTADELAELCDYLDSDDEQIAGDAYSHWCAGTAAREMPRGWVPDGSDIARDGAL